MRRLLSVMVVLAACGPATAEEVYMPECNDPGVGLYDVLWHEGGFVFYVSGDYDAGETVLLVDDCPGQRRLKMSVNDTDIMDKPHGAVVFDAVEKAVRSKQSYSMRQIEAIAREAGARTTLGAASYESCACEKYGTVNP